MRRTKSSPDNRRADTLFRPLDQEKNTELDLQVIQSSPYGGHQARVARGSHAHLSRVRVLDPRRVCRPGPSTLPNEPSYQCGAALT